MSDDERSLGVLVVDDSAVARRLLTHILNSDPGLRVIAEAANGDEAVRLATHHRPDVIVMDVVMPSMGGLEATRKLMELLPTPIVLVSASYDPGDLTKSFEALQAGALTLVAKPSGPQSSSFGAEAAALTITVKLMADVKVIRRRPAPASGPQPATASPPASVRAAPVAIVAIAASTGGPAALATILSGLPPAPPVPILVVQHIMAGFDQGMVDWLDATTPVSVRLARHGERLRAGEVLVAPSEAHLGVTDGARVALSSDPPIGGHRPSATHLFASVARVYGAAAVGAILTGIGVDGVAGLVLLSKAGAQVLAQDEATSVVYGMPQRAASLGIVDLVLPVDQIAGALIAAWNRGKP